MIFSDKFDKQTYDSNSNINRCGVYINKFFVYTNISKYTYIITIGYPMIYNVVEHNTYNIM